MVVNAIYFALLLGNLLLIGASLCFGPRMIRAWRIGAFVNVIALMVMIVPLVNLVVTNHPPPGSGTPIRVLLICILPGLIEFFALVGILRRRMQPQDSDQED